MKLNYLALTDQVFIETFVPLDTRFTKLIEGDRLIEVSGDPFVGSNMSAASELSGNHPKHRVYNYRDKFGVFLWEIESQSLEVGDLTSSLPRVEKAASVYA